LGSGERAFRLRLLGCVVAQARVDDLDRGHLVHRQGSGLSELIADVEPRVSTEDRSFTIALRLASPTAPSERITWTTAAS